MADILTSNLYPPIVDTFMPAFIIDNEHEYCEIIFSLSDFNTVNDIQTDMVQVSIRNQKNNENSLTNNNGIRYYTMTQYQNTDKYSIKIYPNHLIDGQFYIDQYYKVQIRFTKKGNYSEQNYYAGSVNNPSISWINQNLNLFSEWSSVCLIRRISKPRLVLKDFIQIDANTLNYNFQLLKVNGNLTFDSTTETEYLSNYRLILSNSEFTEDSGIIYPELGENINKIKYHFKHKLLRNTNYSLKIIYTTNNLYTEEENFILQLVGSSLAKPVINATPDYDQGRIRIDVNSMDLSGQYYVSIARSSNKTNFQELEEIGLVNFQNGSSAIFFDSSIESGTWYKYSAQLYNSAGAFSDFNEMTNPVMLLYEEMFLNSQGKQLKLRFDSHVTSYRKVTMENKVETLGSVFPYIRKNSNTKYKQFALTGLITFHTDRGDGEFSFHKIYTDSEPFHTELSVQNGTSITYNDQGEIFVTDSELYGGNVGEELYNNYNSTHEVHQYNDYIKEREFREKVIDFLYSGEVFLLRTMTEGLILVKLMDINFTPNQSLNNYIYSFTANAIEIGKCTPENYYKYKIFPHLYSTIQLEV